MSDALPITSKHLHNVFKATTASFRAAYILGRCLDPGRERYAIFFRLASFSQALRFPISSTDVLDYFRSNHLIGDHTSPELPRRLFRSLVPKGCAVGDHPFRWSDRDHPLPFLNYLYGTSGIPAPNPNSHDGYALTKAVHAGFIPLVRFLLSHGASPACKDGLAVMVAIRRKDLTLVRLLIEREDEEKGTAKRRKLENRMQVTSEMLKVAVKCDARDIVTYLTQEQGCVPDLRTLYLLTSQ